MKSSLNAVLFLVLLTVLSACGKWDPIKSGNYRLTCGVSLEKDALVKYDLDGKNLTLDNLIHGQRLRRISNEPKGIYGKWAYSEKRVTDGLAVNSTGTITIEHNRVSVEGTCLAPNGSYATVQVSAKADIDEVAEQITILETVKASKVATTNH